MFTLSIVGAGRAATTIAALFKRHHLVEIKQVICRDYEHALQAVETLGEGIPAKLCDLEVVDLIMLGCPDDQISSCAEQIAELNLHSSQIIFHLSGACSSDSLACLRAQGHACASLHPLKSFADIQLAINTFEGTFCALEGDKQATQTLSEMINEIGGQSLSIQAQQKSIWHLTSVIASNYTIGLMAICEELYESIDIPPEQARQLINPLVDQTVEQYCTLGAHLALTGPIERGDINTIKAHLTSLNTLPTEIGVIYRVLGKILLKIAMEKGRAKASDLDRLQNMLSD